MEGEGEDDHKEALVEVEEVKEEVGEEEDEEKEEEEADEDKVQNDAKNDDGDDDNQGHIPMNEEGHDGRDTNDHINLSCND